MKRLLLYCFLITIISCTSTIQLQPTIQKKDGIQEILIQKGKINAFIRYNGDYWFHDFDNELYPTVSDLYLDDLKSLHKREEVTMLWSSHTMVLPYFSSVALVYEKTDVKQLETDLKSHLKASLKGTNVKSEKFDDDTNQWAKMNYLIFDSITKTQTAHIEYITNIKDKTLRIIFWTLDSNQRSLNNEANKIIKSMKIQ